MNGILLIDKPSGLTSHKVIEIIRNRLKVKKVGHAGTLDPLATGLLVIMVGKATKLSNLLIGQYKAYRVEMKLFLETDTGDITGKTIKSRKNKVFARNQIQETIDYFNNYSYWQKPPLYSAIKIKGKKLYEYARRGLKINVPSCWVTIEETKLVSYDENEGIVSFVAKCSKGTYVRSLVKDIAKKLKTIATVAQLRRISSGNFLIEQAIKLEEVKGCVTFQAFKY